MRRRAHEHGFSLLELMLIAIIVLVLAAIGMFVYAGLKARSDRQACAEERRTIAIAQEAARAESGRYQSGAWLEREGFLRGLPQLYETSPTNDGTTYAITPQDGSPCDG